MIPNIQPPPLWLPQGWTPNALRPTDAQIAQQVINQQSTIFPAITQPNAALLIGTGLSMFRITVTLTEAQLEAINTTPVSVISGVGGQLIIPVAASARANVVTPTAQSMTLRLRHPGNTDDLTGTTAINFNNVGDSYITLSAPALNDFPATGATPVGVGVEVSGSVNLAAVFVGTVILDIVYILAPLGP